MQWLARYKRCISVTAGPGRAGSLQKWILRPKLRFFCSEATSLFSNLLCDLSISSLSLSFSHIYNIFLHQSHIKFAVEKHYYMSIYLWQVPYPQGRWPPLNASHIFFSSSVLVPRVYIFLPWLLLEYPKI